MVFNNIVMENGRLVADGTFLVNGKRYLLGRAIFVLRSNTTTYLYAANSGLNSRFFLSLDTSELKAGTYQLSIAGAVREGNDQANGKMLKGYVSIPYKIIVR